MPQVTRWRSLETWKAAQVVEVLKCALYRGRGWLHWRQLQTEALCAHKLESWERLRPVTVWRSRAFPHNLPQGTRTNRVLLPAFLMIVFWRIDFVKCTMILCPPLAILNYQMLVMMPESQ